MKANSKVLTRWFVELRTLYIILYKTKQKYKIYICSIIKIKKRNRRTYVLNLFIRRFLRLKKKEKVIELSLKYNLFYTSVTFNVEKILFKWVSWTKHHVNKFRGVAREI